MSSSRRLCCVSDAFVPVLPMARGIKTSEDRARIPTQFPEEMKAGVSLFKYSLDAPGAKPAHCGQESGEQEDPALRNARPREYLPIQEKQSRAQHFQHFQEERDAEQSGGNTNENQEKEQSAMPVATSECASNKAAEERDQNRSKKNHGTGILECRPLTRLCDSD